jgi:hypothetical protein
MTWHGEVPVEALAIGDRLRTHAGALWAIRWIGRREYGGRFASRNPDILPVRSATTFCAATYSSRRCTHSIWMAYWYPPPPW